MDDDLKNIMIVNAMRKNKFLKFLHFTSADEFGPNDKMWKLRPITDHIKSNMVKHIHPERNLSYDESMIAYYGWHGC